MSIHEQIQDNQKIRHQETITITFIDSNNTIYKVDAEIGLSLLEVAHKNDINLEGACGGSLACSTCHVIIVDPKIYNSLPAPTDEEEDMLDLAFGVTQTSRLGCQIILVKELDGLVIRIPSATRNVLIS